MHMNQTTRGLTALAVATAALGMAACRRDARLADHTIPHVEIGTVSDQGVVLGPEASPKEVAYVLLKAVREDVLAGSDLDARRQALDRQLAVCDPDYIYDLYRRVFGDRTVDSRDEWVFKKVYLWAPTLAYYVDAFDFDLATAEARMRETGDARAEKWTGRTTLVDLPVLDPKGRPGAGVVVRVRLHRAEGEGGTSPTGGYWRVFGVGFAGRPKPADQARSDSATKPAGG